MAKRPRAGFAKTRLTPDLTAGNAALLAEAFLADAMELAASIPGATAAVAFTPSDAADYFRTLAPAAVQIAQVGSDLRHRLSYVMTSLVERGFAQVVAINGDSPTLPRQYIRRAFEMLETDHCDVVLGPAADGGYYLIGWRQPHPTIITGITMSTPTVLADTVAAADTLGLGTCLTASWYDVDTLADLHRLEQELIESVHPIAPHTAAVLRTLGRIP